MAKQKFRITNWPTYNKALINRGSLTFWLDDETIHCGVRISARLSLPEKERATGPVSMQTATVPLPISV